MSWCMFWWVSFWERNGFLRDLPLCKGSLNHQSWRLNSLTRLQDSWQLMFHLRLRADIFQKECRSHPYTRPSSFRIKVGRISFIRIRSIILWGRNRRLRRNLSMRMIRYLMKRSHYWNCCLNYCQKWLLSNRPRCIRPCWFRRHSRTRSLNPQPHRHLRFVTAFCTLRRCSLFRFRSNSSLCWPVKISSR